MPEVSIITPCYNSSKFLNQTIQSVLNQTFTDWEWLITDDGSTDESIEIIQKSKDSRIILQISRENKGAGFARNKSLEKAQGRFITFLDSDDCWDSYFLEKMLHFMKKENAELAYCSYSRCDEQLNPVISDFRADTEVTFHNLLKTCRLSLLASMYDSKRTGKFYFPTESKREDHVMWLNVLKDIPVGKPLGETLAHYRMRSGSISRDKKDIIIDQYLVYRDFMGFSNLRSLYYTAYWAFNGFKKYSRFFNRRT